MILFMAIAMGLFAAYWIYLSMRPLGEKGAVSAEDWAQLEDDSSALLSRRDRLIDELRDIEFEAALSKIDPRDLEALRSRYENEAVNLMGALEDNVGQYKDRIEADISEVQRRRGKAREANSAGLESNSEQGADHDEPSESVDETAGSAE